jgi:hypothetical protein
MLASFNTLNFELTQHIGIQARLHAREIVDTMTPPSRSSRLRQLFSGNNTHPSPFDSIHLNPEEWTELEELSQQPMFSIYEMHEKFGGALTRILRNRPASFGYETSASCATFIKKRILPSISGEFRIGDPVDLTQVRYLHSFMTHQGMAELGIPYEYSEAITTSIASEAEQVFGTLEVTTTPESVDSWLVKPLGSSTVKQLVEFNVSHPTMVDLVNLTPEELNELQNVTEFLTHTSPKPNYSNTQKSEVPILDPEALNSVEQDTSKLLLRIGVKLGAKLMTAVIVSIAKDPDTSPEMKRMLGFILDFTKGGSFFVDKVITGEEKPNLEADCVQCIRGVLGLS